MKICYLKEQYSRDDSLNSGNIHKAAQIIQEILFLDSYEFDRNEKNIYISAWLIARVNMGGGATEQTN